MDISERKKKCYFESLTALAIKLTRSLFKKLKGIANVNFIEGI